jgi:hypothetical protein
MPTKKQPSAEPADPDTLIRELRALGEKHGWGATGSSVDAQGAVVVSFAKPKPEEDETDGE